MLPRGSTHGNPRGVEWYSFGISFFPAGEGSCLVLETTSLDHGDIPTGLCSRFSQRYIPLDQLFFRTILFHFDAKLLLISSGETSSNRDIFFTDDAAKRFFPTSKISAQEIRHQFFLIWSNLTIMAHIMGLGNQSESWKIIIPS